MGSPRHGLSPNSQDPSPRTLACLWWPQNPKTARNIAKTWFTKGEDAKYFKTCVEAGKQTSIEAADNALIAFKNWNGLDTLKNIKNETLIVWGDQDKSYKKKEIELLKKNILNSSLVIFKECAHNVHLEKVDEFNNKIQEFLNK